MAFLAPSGVDLATLGSRRVSLAHRGGRLGDVTPTQVRPRRRRGPSTLTLTTSAPVNFLEIVIGYVGAAATKSLFIGLVILGTAYLFVDLDIQHPIAMMSFLLLTCLSFSLLGFIIGIWAGNFEQLILVPMLVVTPLVFLGGSFYSISMLPEFWQTVTLFNPVVYLISGFRWAFFGTADVAIGISLGAIALFTLACMGFIWWIFKTGWRIRS